MFLFIMLSFAIITNVSAISAAEVNGATSDHALGQTNIVGHDVAGERSNAMQSHVDDLKSHNEQKSFDKSPKNIGDKNNRNVNLYGHNGEKPSDFNVPKNVSSKDKNIPKPMDHKNNASLPPKKDIKNMSDMKPMDNKTKKVLKVDKKAKKNINAKKINKKINPKLNKKVNKNIKIKKTANKKMNSLKKIKKINNNLSKMPKKEMAKL